MALTYQLLFPSKGGKIIALLLLTSCMLLSVKHYCFCISERVGGILVSVTGKVGTAWAMFCSDVQPWANSTLCVSWLQATHLHKHGNKSLLGARWVACQWKEERAAAKHWGFSDFKNLNLGRLCQKKIWMVLSVGDFCFSFAYTTNTIHYRPVVPSYCAS